MEESKSPFKSREKPTVGEIKPRENRTMNPGEMIETLDTMDLEQNAREEPRHPKGKESKFLLVCNICTKAHVKDKDDSQILPCSHVYLQKSNSAYRKRYPSRYSEMCFRMKAILQGYEDVVNKRLVDNYYDFSPQMMAQYQHYGKFKGSIQQSLI